MEKLELEKALISYRPTLLIIARYFVKNPEDVNDLVQDTIVNALNRYDSLDHISNFKPWIYTLLKNRFINDYRVKQRRNKVFIPGQSVDWDSNYVANISSIENIMTMAVLLPSMEKIIPKIYFTVVMLHANGFTYAEIAETQNVPIGTIKSRIHIGRNIIVRALVYLNYLSYDDLPAYAKRYYSYAHKDWTFLAKVRKNMLTI